MQIIRTIDLLNWSQIFTNVQVLKGIPVSEFMSTMGFFSASVGLNCVFCHVPETLQDWKRFADDVPRKRIARGMIAMVKTINKTNFGGRAAITCYSCHHGNGTPGFSALEAEEREAALLPPCSRSAVDAADALENDLFEEYKRLGFASESEVVPVRRSGARLSSDEKAQVRSALASGMTQAAVASRFGITQGAVSSIDSQPSVIRIPRLSPDDMRAIRASKGLLRVLASQYGVSMSRISTIRNGL
jgi:Photosynthetic reaction centre cytochrome C subunit